MIIEHCRDIEEFRKLYESRPMPVQYDFEFLINNPLLFCFYGEEDKKLKAYLTIQKENIDDTEYLTLSGASIRKNMSDNINAIVSVCKAIKQDIWALTKVKPAEVVLRRAGFKKVKENLYKRCYNGEQ